MFRGLFVSAALLVWLFATPVYSDDAVEMQASLQRILQKYSLPGGVAATISRGKVQLKVSAGVRKQGDPTPLSPDDKLHLGSCTKAMTSTVIGMLVDEGKLSWTTTLAEAFPEFANDIHPDYRDVNISELVSHYSGAPANCEWRQLGMDKPVTEQRLEMIRTVFFKPPFQKPHDQQLYSNVGYVAAGAILEKVTGKSWEDLITERLFEPLKMTSAGFGPPSIEGSVNQPWGHVLQETTLVPVQNDNPPVLGPAGTVHMSIEDWTRFASLHLGTTRIKPALLQTRTLNHLQTPYSVFDKRVTAKASPYGFGWVFTERPWGGGKVFTHNGSNRTWNSLIWMAPEKKAGFLAAVNAETPEADKALDDIMVELIRLWSKK